MGHRERLIVDELEKAGLDRTDAFYFPTKEDAKKAKSHIKWLKDHGLNPSGVLLMVSRRDAVPEAYLDLVRNADFERKDHDTVVD